jgi:HEAT repeat protein
MNTRSSLLPEVATGRQSAEDWRWKARRVLARLGHQTIPALVEALRRGEDPIVRGFAADSLGRLGTEARGASEALRHAAWHDADPFVREASAAALAAVGEAGPSQ